MSACPAASLTRLIETHARLQEAFTLHQEALLDMDFPAALRHLDAHAALIRRHIGEEEDVLLPLFGARGGEVLGGTVSAFSAEHRHIERRLEELWSACAALRLDDPGIRRRVIALLDLEWMYKHLLDHHDRRERNVLYPSLDRVTTAEERERMLVACPTLAGEPGK